MPLFAMEKEISRSNAKEDVESSGSKYEEIYCMQVVCGKNIETNTDP